MEKLGLNDFVKPEKSTEENTNEAISRIAIEHLFAPENLKSNSRVKFVQVADLTKLYLYADIFQIGFIKSLADNILQLQISTNGLGRKELVDLVRQVSPVLPEEVKISKKEIFR